MQRQVSTTKHPRKSIRDTTLRLQTNSQVKLREGLKHTNFSYKYTKIEGLLKAAADGHLPNNDTIQEIGDHLGDDLQGEELPVELLMLKNSFQAMHFTMKNLKDQLLRYCTNTCFRSSASFRLLLIMPATSATSERSFSSLRLVKY